LKTAVVLLGLFGGFYIVPLYALIQQRSDPTHRSRIFAGNNVLNALAMVIAAVFSVVFLEGVGLTIPQLFLLTGVLNAAVALYIFTLVPEFLLRFIAWMGIHTFYRMRKQGMERIPAEGGAVLVCNHVSYVDAIIIAGAIKRPVRFVMYHKIFRIPVLSRLFHWMNAIPIAPAKEDPALLKKAYDQIDAALAAGELVCLFPEGRLTGDGDIGPFRKGVERILRRRPVPVVPMALGGVWGSLFSRCGGRAFFKMPRRVWNRIHFAVGEAVAAEDATAETLQHCVETLRGSRP
jgi:1-acyl-sn-glycerol-3-phosphate acyltransferase